MPSIVFFGLDGAYSTAPLRALSNSGLKPRLVVRGADDPNGRLRPWVKRRPARPGPIARLLRRGDRPDPAGGLVPAAHALGVDAVETTDGNAAALQSILRKLRPELLVVAGFPHLLSTQTLGLFSRGAINIHPGRLPQERGPAPLFWSLKAGRTRVDMSVHLIDAGEDTGDVLHRAVYRFEPGASGSEILAGCATAALPGLLKAARDVLAGEVVREAQDPNKAQRRPRPRFSDGRLDTSRSAEEVYTFVCACARRFSLFVEIANDRFFIAGATDYDMDDSLQYDYALIGDRLLLSCTPGVVELELKPDGALFAPDYSP